MCHIFLIITALIITTFISANASYIFNYTDSENSLSDLTLVDIGTRFFQD